MISDLGIWTIVINLIAIAFAVKYSHLRRFRDALLWLVWDFSGLRFVWSKLSNQSKEELDKNPPVTFVIWGLGIYTALFGIASNRFENSVDKIENRMNTFITQLTVVTNPDIRKAAFSEIAEIQQMRCPVLPDLTKPSTVILSLVKYDRYNEAVTVLTRTVQKYQDKLEGVNLAKANLKGADLREANLQGAFLFKANLQDAHLNLANVEGAMLVSTNFKDAELKDANLTGANLWMAKLQSANLSKAILKDSNLSDANLTGADLSYTNLTGAKLSYADLKGAYLRGADITGADLSYADLLGIHGAEVGQVCSSWNLFRAHMDPTLEAKVNKQCQELLRPPAAWEKGLHEEKRNVFGGIKRRNQR